VAYTVRVHVDWYSFTFTPIYPYDDQEQYTKALADGLREQVSVEIWKRVFEGAWKHEQHGRAPYQDCWVMDGGGLRLYSSPTLTHATIEISGEGCEKLIEAGDLRLVIARTMDRCTRVDIACDIETRTLPADFVAEVKHKRMRASGHYVSSTGETCYVGSQKSERFARVYRYADPHPRSHLLRIEHVFRKDYAKKVAEACVRRNLEDIAAAAGEAFGWSHDDWRVQEVSDVDISVVGTERKANNTIFWLVNSCAPAFLRLVESGEIRDRDAFLDKYFR